MWKLLTTFAVVALVFGQTHAQPWGPEEGQPGVERPHGFPYVYPYVQAPYAGYLPGYYGGYGFPYNYNYFPHAARVPHGAYPYLGHFTGSCEGAADGLYYVNENSFAFCSNGIKSVQECAEGSANRPLNFFHTGNYYTYADFCSVNLADKPYH